MKASVLFILFLFCGAALQAQDSIPTRKFHPYSFGVTAGTGICLKTPKTTPFIFQVAGYYYFGDRFALSAGTGYSIYSDVSLVPLFAGVHYNFIRNARWLPYAACNTGYSFAPSAKANGGFLLSPSVGASYTIHSDWRITASAGYELQKMERLKSHTDSYFTYEFKEKLSHHILMFRLGVLF